MHLHIYKYYHKYQGSHTPFWDWGLGPLELGKIAAFCLKLGKNNKTYFVIHILVSFNMFKCTCIFIYTVLLDFTYCSTQFVIFLPFFSIFFSRSQIGKTWGLNWEKKILFCIGNGAEIRPQIRQIESPEYKWADIDYPTPDVKNTFKNSLK